MAFVGCASRIASLMASMFVFVMPCVLADPPPLPTSTPAPDFKLVETSAPVPPLPDKTFAPIHPMFSLGNGKQMPVGLKDMLELALGQNIRLQIAQEEAKQKKLDYKLALSDILPDVTMQYTQSRFMGGTQIFGGQTIQILRTTIQPQLGVNYEISTFGDKIFQIRSTKKKQRAQESLLENTRQQLLYDVSVGYFDLQRAYWEKAIALQSMSEAKMELDIGQGRLAQGIGIPLDVMQAKTNYMQQEQQQRESERHIAKATHHLSQLLDMDLDIEWHPNTMDSALSWEVPNTFDIKSLEQVATLHNPELKSYEWLRRASKDDYMIALSTMMPKISAAPYVNYTGPRFDRMVPSKFVGVVVKWDLLENGGFAKPIRALQARSIKRTLDLDARQSKRSVFETLYNSIVDIKTNEAQLSLSQEKLTVAKQAFDVALGRFKEGIGTLLDVEKTQSQLSQSRLDVMNAFIKTNEAQLMLLKSLGQVSPESILNGVDWHAITTLAE